MNLFQHLVISVLFINKHIFGKHNSAVSLPLQLSCLQIAEQFHLGSRFRQINVPEQAVAYWVHGKDYDKGDGGSCPCDDQVRLSAFKDESDELYVTLLNEKNKKCATRHLIKLKGDKRCTSGDIERYRKQIQDNHSNGLSKDRVVFNVDWHKTCDVAVGSEQKFKCSHGIKKNSPIQWYQEFDKSTSVPIGDRNTLIMKIDYLDRNTALVCYPKGGELDENKEIVRHPIKLSTGYSTTTENASHIPPRYYNDTSQLYSCKKNQRPNEDIFVMLIQNQGSNVTKYSSPLPFTFKEKDTGSILSCIHIIRKQSEVVRFISKKERFIFKNYPHIRTYSPTKSPVTTTLVHACRNYVKKPDTPIQVTSTRKPEPEPLKVGEEKVLNCSRNSHSERIAWPHYFPKGNLTIYIPTPVNITKYKLNLTLEEFDDNTTLTCVKSQTTESVILSVMNSTTDVTHTNEKYYNEETILEYNCSQFSVFHYVIQVKPNKNISMLTNKKGTKMKFTKADNNSILYCLYFVTENTPNYCEVTRHVREISLFIYQEKKEESEFQLMYEDFKSYYFIGGAITGSIVLTIIAILFWKCYNKSKKSASENNYEDTGRITYAELDLQHVPNNNQKPTMEETPYAEIVLYENKPYLDHQISPENTESPYANC